MLCQKCGNELEDSAKFCNICGTMQTSPVKEEEPSQQTPITPITITQVKSKKQPNKKVILLCGVLGVALLAGIITLVAVLRNPVRRAVSLAEGGNGTRAEELYWDSIYGNENRMASLSEKITNNIEEIKQDYLDKTITQESAAQAIDLYACFPDQSIQSLVEQGVIDLEALSRSAKAYEDGAAYMDSQDYKNAILSLQEVSADAPEHEDAQTLLTDAVESYRQSVLSSAESYAQQEDFSQAIATIDEALLILPEDAKLTEQQKVYQTKNAEQIKQDTIQQAEAAISEGDWVSAIELLLDAQETLPEDTQINQLLTESSDKYTEAVLATADELLANAQYDEATAQVNQALRLLPDNETLKKKLEDIKAVEPVSLEKEILLNSSNWAWNDGEPKDPFGNDYSTCKNYVILDYSSWNGVDYYGEFRLYQQYSRLTGQIAPYIDIGENATAYIQVFADDELIYTSPTVSRKTDAFTFDLDITGCEYLKIVINVPYDAGVILSDLMLTP